MKVGPHNVGFETILRNGTRAWIRPVQPDDKDRIQTGMKQLSAESRYWRFFNEASELQPDLLQYLTEVDQRNHVAWIAVNMDLPHTPGIGIARFVRSSEQPQTAELALTVIDSFQGLGLGASLLNILLVRAEQLGISSLRAVVLPDNHRVLQWMHRLGASISYKDGTIEMILAVEEGNRAPVLEPAPQSTDRTSVPGGSAMQRPNSLKHMALAADG